MPYIDLLRSLPKTKRNIKARAEAKDPEVVRIAKQFGAEYFDGDRKYGYGGYYQDRRWKPVAKDIINFFKLEQRSVILDIGCAKGFLIADLINLKMDAYGLDISPYAICAAPYDLRMRMITGTAERLPWPDKSFDLVVSINVVHNLSRAKVIEALKEIERVGKGKSYIVVDAYKTEEEKKLFLSWCLTAETHGTPDFWLDIFKEAGYNGYYSFNIMNKD